MKANKNGVDIWYTKSIRNFDPEMLEFYKGPDYVDFKVLWPSEKYDKQRAIVLDLEQWLNANVKSWKHTERGRKILEEEYGVHFPRGFSQYIINCVDFTTEDDLKKYVNHFEWRDDYQNLTLFDEVILKLDDTNIAFASYRTDGWWDFDANKLYSFTDKKHYMINYKYEDDEETT